MAADDLSRIVDVVNRYAVAVDARRYELFEAIFTADIRCDFGGGAAFTDRDTLIAVYRDIHAVFAATQHMTSGHTIDVTEDGARCFSYVCGRFRRRIAEGEAEGLFESTGWYDDRLVRTPQGWRISERRSRMVSYTGDIRVMQAMPGIDTRYHLVSLFGEADRGEVAFLPR